MIQAWIESVVIKRVVLALAAAAVAQLTGNLIPDLSPWLEKLAAVGLVISVKVTNPALLRETICLVIMAGLQGFHEWAAVRWPEATKWI